MFFKISVPKSFAIFKAPVLEPLGIKVAGLLVAILKRNSNTSVSCKYCDVFKNSSFIKYFQWLLLDLVLLRSIYFKRAWVPVH